MFVRQARIDGLGNLRTLVVDEAAGVAAVVDPRRDVDVYLAAAREHDLRITHVVETHLHNDYVSGGRELAAATGAEQVIGAGAELAYPYRPVRPGDAFAVGSLRFTALGTPSHSPSTSPTPLPTPRAPLSRCSSSPRAPCWSARSAGSTSSARITHSRSRRRCSTPSKT